MSTARMNWATSSLGERIEHICQLRGWSLNKLGDESGLASGVMSRLARRTATLAGTPDTLGRVAEAAGVNVLWLIFGRGPIERSEGQGGMLRNHPQWRTALAEAQKRQRGIPEDFWELAGDSVLPPQVPVDWNLLVGLVREIYSAHQRALEDEAERQQQAPPGEPAASTPRAPTSSRKRAASTKR